MSASQDGPYDNAFFSSISPGSLTSAHRVLPLAMAIQPCKTIIDVGCGTGSWLAAAGDLGVNDLIGVDGHYVDHAHLQIDSGRFIAADLATLTIDALRTEPIVGSRRFDIAMSVEVAEHLPEASAAGFVAMLTSLSDVVLFSAAIPFQGGESHVNEQFPSWWAKQFAIHGFVPVDTIRDRIWSDTSVEWWYRQNILLFVSSSHPAASAPDDGPGLDRVHPAHYRRIVDWGMLGQKSSGIPWVDSEQAVNAVWPL